VIFYWKRFLFDDLGPALFNGNAAVPVPVVPDLIYNISSSMCSKISDNRRGSSIHSSSNLNSSSRSGAIEFRVSPRLIEYIDLGEKLAVISGWGLWWSAPGSLKSFVL
jgi:hypothetical protein